MAESTMLDKLSSVDHQAIKAIIDQLYECQSHEQLDQLLNSALVPLMNCSGIFFARLEGERYIPQPQNITNQSPLCQCRWQDFLEVATQSHLVESLLTDDTDLMLATEAYSYVGDFCPDCPMPQANRLEYRCGSVLVLFDSLSPAVALYFYRFTPTLQCFSMREIKLLKLLRTTLMQTLKAVIYQEECHILQNILNYLPDYIEPLAVVQSDGSIVYKNKAFDRDIEQAILPHLSIVFSKQNFDSHIALAQPDFIIRQGRRSYSVTVSPVPLDKTNDSTRIYLLQLARITIKDQHISRQLSNAGLTQREFEIVALLQQSLSVHNISEQLNLSYHTVRNHIKHIYSKIGVTSRSEMMTWGE